LVAHAAFEENEQPCPSSEKKGQLKGSTPSNEWMKEDHLKRPRTSRKHVRKKRPKVGTFLEMNILTNCEW
jgi:hypothetical protein